MAWIEVFALFVVSHAVGDYVLQTEFQAINKRGGLGRAVRWWLVHVKHTRPGQVTLDMLVDQTFHLVVLLAVALVVGG